MSQPTGSPTRRSPFVGREQEITALTDRLEAVGRGEGQIVFVRGEPGIGKSRLLGQIADRAHRAGWLTLSGRAYDMEGMPPYLPFIEVLREHLDRVSDEPLAALASGAPELCLLLPEVRSRIAGLPELPSLGPVVDRFRLFEAICGFLVNVARQSEAKGLVVLLDDLHWADRTTLLLVQHLARKLAGTPLLVVAAYRTTDLEPGHPLQNVLADLARERLCEQMLLPPLSEAAASALITNLTGTPASPSVASSLHRETDGNPFFIEELVRHSLESRSEIPGTPASGEGVPEGIRQVLDQRLNRLHPNTNTVLQTAAVLGGSVAFELLSATCTLDLQSLISGVEEAQRAGMLREERGGYVFGHTLIRRTVYDGLSVPRRRQIHLRAAEAMESASKATDDSNLAAVAHHWRLSGHPQRAIDHLLRAGDAALSLTAWQEAAGLWEAALECMEQTREAPARRARLLEGLGDLHFLSSFEAHPCVECYERASALYESSGDTLSAARAQSRAGRSLAYPTSGFDYPRALDHLRAAEPVLSSQPASLELGELYAAIAHAESHALRNRPDQMIEAMRLVEEISGKLDNEFLRDFLHVQSYHLRGHYLGLQGRLADGLALEELACETAIALNDKGGAVNEWPEHWREFLLAYSSQDTSSAVNDAGSFQFFRVHSRAGLCTFTKNCCGWQLLDLHDPVAAKLKHEQLRDAQGRFISPFFLFDLFLSGDTGTLRRLVEAGTSALSTLNPETLITARLLVDWVEGRWAEVERGYLQRLHQWGQQGARGLVAWTDHPLLRLARVRGDVTAAGSAARELLDVSLSSGAVKYEFYARAELALLLAESGELAEAEPHLARIRDILKDGEDWRGLGGRATLAEAVYSAELRHGDEAEEHFQRAVNCFAALSLPWDEAETFEIWARSCRRFYRGRSRESFMAEKLGASRAIYERIGAGQPWLDRLDALRQSLARNATTNEGNNLPDGLSSREVQVLRLVATGWTNKQIASDLFISLNTVARHVSNIFDKTGATNRADAAAYAARHGLAD